MKKLSHISMIILILFLLTACTYPSIETNTSNNEASDNKSEENHDENQDNYTQSETTNSEEDDISIHESLADFEEGPHLEDTIDDLTALTVNVEVDNTSKRILYFENATGQKQYKSIFIKKKKHLKIIQLNDNDGILFNEDI